MYKHFSTLILLQVLVLLSCNHHQEDHRTLMGRFSQRCLIEAVSEGEKPDSTIRRETTKDSIVFSRQEIRNCCGHEKDSIILTEVNDTIRLVNVSEDQSDVRVQCDCNCLFESRLVVSKEFYDTLKKPMYFGRHKLN